VGFEVAYRECDGGHTILTSIAREAIERLLNDTP